ncbi:hypothetical protein EXIGLDRAFT_6499 [Exidia glandulosa HHB12029]|uniref:Uncharacterized protein n=1 Tax=Exidia glandulosa HHB12029 TaxID=1314781 RepID=A0A165QN85_EXIGL|nr:hypothetical protein EXIGLDRAFT_6499 [Exidia glandulosa HHB12029]
MPLPAPPHVMERVSTEEALQEAIALRIEVFVHEQKFPLETEVDHEHRTSPSASPPRTHSRRDDTGPPHSGRLLQNRASLRSRRLSQVRLRRSSRQKRSGVGPARRPQTGPQRGCTRTGCGSSRARPSSRDSLLQAVMSKRETDSTRRERRTKRCASGSKRTEKYYRYGIRDGGEWSVA